MTVPVRQPDNDPIDGQLALHLRRLRQWYGKHGLTQEELAALAQVPQRNVRQYERATALPRVLEMYLRTAIALRVPVERLVAPWALDRLVHDIEPRRRTFDEAPNFPSLTERAP